MASTDDIQKILNQIWIEFRKAGIADDVKIIDHLCNFLTDSIPSKVAAPKGVDPVNIQNLLNKIIQDLPAKKTKGYLLDRHIFFRISKMLPGKRYPTPRHLVKLIHNLAQVEDHHKLADLACGTGSFLVYRKNFQESVEGEALNFGCEISTVWSNFALANCKLHENPDVEILTGNSIEIQNEETKTPLAFDRILMNPPFGEKLDKDQVKEQLGEEAGSRSETIFTKLSLKYLKPDGRLVLLIPSGILFSSSTAENNLRKDLINSHYLEGVISLPKDALQPFGSTKTYILIARKKKEILDDYSTWFFKMERDGYPAGRSRNLFEDPDPAKSDFPLVQEGWLKKEENWEEAVPETNPLIGMKSISIPGSKNNQLGVLLEVDKGVKFKRLEYFESGLEFINENSKKDLDPLPFLMGSIIDKEEQITDFKIDIKNMEISSCQAQEVLSKIREARGLSENESLPRKSLLLEKEEIQKALVSNNGRLLGVAVFHQVIKNKNLEIRPEQYIREVEEEYSDKTPADLLKDIRQNQQSLLQKIDSLMGKIESPSVSHKKTIPAVWEEMGKTLEPLGALSREQELIWKCISQEIGEIKEEEKKRVPLHFTVAKIVEKVERMEKEEDFFKGMEIEPAVKRTIEIFEKMGLILPFTFSTSEEQERTHYRLVSVNDIWEGESA